MDVKKRLRMPLLAAALLLGGCASTWQSVSDRLDRLFADDTAELDRHEIAILTDFETAAGPQTPATSPASLRIRTLGDDVTRALADPSRTDDARIAYFRDLLAENLDIPLIARFVLGASWRTASPEQRQAYVAVFSDFLVGTYARRLGGAEVRRFEIVDQIPIGEKDTLVRTRIAQSGSQPLDADWRLRERGGKLRILDLSVEGISMAVVMRQDFASILRNQGGVDGLIRILAERKG